MLTIFMFYFAITLLFVATCIVFHQVHFIIKMNFIRDIDNKIKKISLYLIVPTMVVMLTVVVFIKSLPNIY